MSYDYTFKIIFGGDGGVGKTTLLHRYIEGKFLVSTMMTIGVDIHNKQLRLDNDKTVALQLWDFGGQDRFRFFLDSFVMGANGAFLMFDLTKYSTFENLPNWMGILRKYNPNLPLVLLGSKADLEEYVIVSEELALQFKIGHNLIDYIVTSSKTGLNVEQAFKVLVDFILKSQGLDGEVVF